MVEELLLEVIKEMLSGGKQQHEEEELERKVSLRKVSRVMISKLKGSTPSGFHNVPWKELGMKVVDKVAKTGVKRKRTEGKIEEVPCVVEKGSVMSLKGSKSQRLSGCVNGVVRDHVEALKTAISKSKQIPEAGSAKRKRPKRECQRPADSKRDVAKKNVKAKVAKMSVSHAGKRCFVCGNCTMKLECYDPSHNYKSEMFVRHFEGYGLQKEKKKLSTQNHKSKEKVELEGVYVGMKKESLVKSNKWLNELRKGIGRAWERGSVCNPQKACKEKEKYPCIYLKGEKGVVEKENILKGYEEFADACGLKTGFCGVCDKRAEVKTTGAFWIHLIRFHHRDVGVSCGRDDCDKDCGSRIRATVGYTKKDYLEMFPEGRRHLLNLPEEFCPDNDPDNKVGRKRTCPYHEYKDKVSKKRGKRVKGKGSRRSV